MKPKIKATRAKLQLQLLSFCLLCLSGKTRCDGNGPAVVTVEQDRDAVLPCSLNTKENIEAYHFEWKKAAQKDGRQKEVFFYDAGITYDSGRPGQSEEFKGRVSHSEEGLRQGNASIIIRNTAVSDSGDYTCDFPHLQPRQMFHIKLVVDRVLKDRTDENIPGATSKPNIRTLDEKDNRMPLQCEANGNPDPEVEWRDSAGNKLPAEEPQVTGRDGRFFITLNTAVTKTDRYRCVATQESISHQISTETFVLIPQPVVVRVKQDEDALLPCFRSTENITQGHFDWNKVPQNNDKQKEVFRYEEGKHSNSKPPYGSQDGRFNGQVFHFPEELKHGNASIIIRKTKMDDNGNYTCVFTEPRQTFHIQLVVGATSKPNIRTLDQTDNSALLLCEVHGNPEPEVEWRDSAGKTLPAQKSVVPERDGFFITLNTTVTKTDHYRCVATQESISHQISTETFVRLNGPTPAKVKEGNDVILPCSLRTEQNIESEMFEWKKEGLKEVFFYGGIHYNGNHPGQSEEFKGRVSHFPEELKHGDASITITNTKMSDSGDYTCDFPRLQPRQTFHIKLTVLNDGSGVHSSDGVLKDRSDEHRGAASKPNIRTRVETEDWALLQCDVNGNPPPEVEWRDSAGNKLHAEEPQVSKSDGRFYVTLNTTVTKTDRYRCVATQKSISHQIYDETFVLIPVPGSSTGWIVGFFLLLALLIVGVVLAVLVLKGYIPLNSNKGSPTHQMEAVRVPLNDKSNSPTAPKDDSKDPLNDKSTSPTAPKDDSKDPLNDKSNSPTAPQDDSEDHL